MVWSGNRFSGRYQGLQTLIDGIVHTMEFAYDGVCRVRQFFGIYDSFMELFFGQVISKFTIFIVAMTTSWGAPLAILLFIRI